MQGYRTDIPTVLGALAIFGASRTLYVMADFDHGLLDSDFFRDLRREVKFVYDTVAYICLVNGILLILAAVFGLISERSDNHWFSTAVRAFILQPV
ncbi:unnamed protein product [Dibothriocephalus latus]|uniref:Uncharacterized protein n=1 Tax=Dibothriocephalus latus TaxID=60516 RepID=A0A3P7MZP0_DIBLA|nr:unnamed protein product [Dibothriocephalus latus]